jgi:uncharacterized protein YhaN
MKIEQIDLKAYGHFTNQRLALGGAANFHIICGPNEAGKTTLWRAINGALFGIPEQTRDGHLHTNPKLRVGLALSSQAGDRLAVMRRKGRVNTLLKYDPATGDELSDAVSDDRLREWLGGLSQGLFLAMFSLDHDALVLGGEALAQGKGDAGESLFEAGAGLSSIRTLRTKLEREAESLFKPRASTSVIYKSLSEYDDTRKQAKEAIIRPADWTSAKSVMDTASKAYEEAKAEQTQLQREARRLERLAAILPDVAALGLAQQRLAELVGVPELPPSAPAERIAAVTKRNNAIDAERSASVRLAQHQGDLASVQYNEAILVDAESIEAIHHATTTYRDATVQLATADAVIESAQGNFDAALKQISSETSDIEVMQWIPDSTRLARIRALITSGATLKAKHDADLKTLGEKKLAVAQLNAELLGLGQDSGATGLAAYLDSIADHGDPEARALQLEGEVSTAEAKLDTEAGALKMTSANSVAATTIPLDAVVQQYKTDDDELRRQARSIRDAKEKLEDDLASLQAEIKGLEVRGDVPTKEAVTGERTRRNELWLSIRRHFMPLQGEPAAKDPPPPAERYEHAVTSADDAADGLFADAERATRYAELRVRESQMQSALELAKSRTDSVVTNQAALHTRWTDLLASHRLPIITIAEASTWITKREAFLQKIDSNQTKRQETQHNRALAEEIRVRIAELFQQLSMDPPASAERLSELLARARIISKQHADQLTQRGLKKTAQANAEIAKSHAEGEETTSRNKLDEWGQQWSDAMQAIRLAYDASPEEATARIEQFAGLQEAHDALENAKGDRRKAQIQIDDFATRLAGTWQSVHGEAVPLDGRSHELLAADLYRELTDARTLQQLKATLTQQVADDQLAISDARELAEGAKKTIDKLLLQANCITLESLELVEGQSAQRSTLTVEVREIETRLVKSAGMSLTDALSQAAGQDPDAVAEALDNNSLKIEENATLVQKRHEDYLATRQEFEKMDGSAAAADAQQKLAQHSARIAELGADYAASRIATAVLAQVIDTYQKRNQGPLIEQASKRYAAITGGRYSDVVIDYDEEKQILKAVRADGERLTMEQLSTGRRDQLFLALRLAAIEGHLDKREPLPIIIDDILIQFDDAAAAATFKVLADLSKRTQVLFLTHHEHLLEVAEAAIGINTFAPHRLSI